MKPRGENDSILIWTDIENDALDPEGTRLILMGVFQRVLQVHNVLVFCRLIDGPTMQA